MTTRAIDRDTRARCPACGLPDPAAIAARAAVLLSERTGRQCTPDESVEVAALAIVEAVGLRACACQGAVHGNR